MKILHITPSYKPAYIYGGPIASVSKLCEFEVRSGHVVHVATTNANGRKEHLKVPTNTFQFVDGVLVRYFKSQVNDTAYVSFGLWVFLIRNCKKYDIVHIHSWWNLLAVISCLICQLRGMKIIISPRGMLNPYIFNSGKQKVKRILHSTIGRQLLRKCIFHATSNQEYNDCIKLINGWEGFVIPNMIELPNIDIEKNENSKFSMTFLSRIHQVKGLEFLFEAIALIEFPLILRIAGRGDDIYINKLKQLSKELQIEDKIEWIGWHGPDDKFLELMNADMFVLTSYTENFACVIIEALYMGTPVLISEPIGLSNFVKENDLGWVSVLDSKAIAKSIIDANFNLQKRKHIQSIARSIIVNHFSEETLGEEYINEYNKIVHA